MIKTLIIDDESQSRNTLKKLLTRFTNNITIVGDAYDVASGIEAIKKKKPELVFLDISMPDGTGFDTLNGCKNEQFEAIFTTAYSEYAIKAIRANALDYLLKPISISDLKAATVKAYEKIKKNSSNKYIDNHSELNKIAVATINGHKFIEKESIIYLHAKGAYTEICCVNNVVHTCSHNLKYYESLLSSKQFFRIHNSYMINISHVLSFNKGDGSYIVMIDNSCVPISRRKKKDFLNRFHI